MIGWFKNLFKKKELEKYPCNHALENIPPLPYPENLATDPQTGLTMNLKTKEVVGDYRSAMIFRNHMDQIYRVNERRRKHLECRYCKEWFLREGQKI